MGNFLNMDPDEKSGSGTFLKLIRCFTPKEYSENDSLHKIDRIFRVKFEHGYSKIEQIRAWVLAYS